MGLKAGNPLCGPITRGTQRQFAVALLAGVGIAFWAWFFSWGRLDLDFEDWPKERVYLDVMREALQTGKVPLHMNHWLQGTNRFLALPETVTVPQTLLLPWLSNGRFILLHICLMHLMGVAGCWAIARRFDWGLAASIAFGMVFCFNGFIVARMAVGHFMWTSYFLFPFALLTAMDIIGGRVKTTHSVLKMAGVLSLMFFVGGFHLAFWWLLFLGVVGLFRPRLLWRIFVVGVLTALVSMGKILPAALTLGNDRTFGTGYPDFATVLAGLVEVRTYSSAAVVTPGATLGWWEFDHFIGWVALVFCLVFAFLMRNPGKTGYDRSALLVGGVVLALFSYGRFYAPICDLPLPLANSERITTRFLSVPFLIILFMGCDGFNARLRSWPWWAGGCAALLGLAAGMELFQHAWHWQPERLEQANPPSPYWPDSAAMRGAIVEVAKELKYKWTVASGWTISVVTLCVAVAVGFRSRQSEEQGQLS
jgi:hypothetical protein